MTPRASSAAGLPLPDYELPIDSNRTGRGGACSGNTESALSWNTPARSRWRGGRRERWRNDISNMEPRDLTDRERSLLDLLLTRDFAGVDELRRQTSTVRTTGLSCTCGCPSFSLVPDRVEPAAVSERMVSDAHGTDPLGNSVTVLLFVEDGYLAGVEVLDPTGEHASALAGRPESAAVALSRWSKSGRLLNP
jgi:hypothetical protein